MKETSGGTTEKIAIGDFVVNNLTSTATNKVLSAAQGKMINDKIGNAGSVGTKIPWLYSFADGTIQGNATTTFNIPNNTKSFMIIASVNNNSNAVLFVNATGSGEVRVVEVKTGSNFTYDMTEANKLKITNSFSTAAYAYALIFDGNGIS